jgi:FkbM family methyltransferase
MVPGLTTWRRRALDVLPRLGLRVVDLTPGTVLLTRGTGPQVRPLDPDAFLITRRRRRAGRTRRWFDREKALVDYLVHEHVSALLDRYRVNLVVDVGANRGQYVSRLRAAGYAGHVASFEPVAEVFAQLREAAADDPRWTVHPYALGREDATTSMHVVPGTLSSVLAPTDFGARRYEKLRATTEQAIEVRRLDGLLDELLAPVPDPRPYLKLDTQGYDLEVFAGLGDRASEFVGMQSELALMTIYEGMPRLPDALGTYEAAGFEVTGLYPVSRERRTGRVLEFDCVMVRADAV